MATRLIGTDSANPRLPALVIGATQGTTHDDLAPGDLPAAKAAEALTDANAYTDDALTAAKAYTDAELAAALIDPDLITFADVAETIAGDATGIAVSPAGFHGALPYIDVRSYGAKGDGSIDDTAAVQAAATAATSVLVFPAGTYKITGPIVPVSGIRIVGARGATIRQDTQFMPVFDLFNVNNVTIEGLTLINGSGPPSTVGTAFRGDSGYAYSAGVWTNGERHTLADLRIVDFAMGINLGSSDGTTNVGDHVERIGNTVRNVEISGCNHGVLFLNQNRLVVDGVQVRSHVDSSAGVNPMHAVYGTGAAADTSTDVTIVNCLDIGSTTGTAYQAKYVNGLVMANLTARGCLGLFNGQDLYDVTASNLSSIGDIAPAGASAAYAFSIGHVTAASARIAISGVLIVKAVEAQGECSFVCNDSKFSNFTLHVLKNGANTNAQDIRVHGARVTLDGFKLRNSGSSNAKGFLVGSSIATADITISNFELDNYRNLIDVHGAVTGLNVFDYAPFAQRRISFGTGSYIMPVSGSPPFTVTRRETTITYALVSGNAWPLAGLETVSRFNITAGTAFTVKLPQIGAQIGMVHELAIHNGTAGALGAITWDPGYVFAVGAPAAPAAGATKNIRFMYNGTNWRECA